MFQISRRADYAVRIMVELSFNPDQCVPARQIARRTQVPKAFLHKIAADLVKAGLVQTHAGPSGGLILNHPIDQINLRQIVEAVEGPICLNVCLIRPLECNRDILCPAHDVWGRLQTLIVEQLEASTLAVLVAEAHDLQANPRRRDHIPYLIAESDVQVSDDE